MRLLLIAATLSLGLAGAGMARAEDEDCHVPMADWQPRSAVVRLTERNLWQVYRIKTNDGCYQIKARDPQGRQIEVTLDPATLSVLRLEYEDLNEDDDHADEPGDGGSNHGGGD